MSTAIGRRASPRSTATCGAVGASAPPVPTSAPCYAGPTSRWSTSDGQPAAHQGRPRRRRRLHAPAGVTSGWPPVVILCGGAFNSRSCCGCRGSVTPGSCARSASTCATTCRAWASTSRTTSRSTCSTPARSRCRSTRRCRSGAGRGSGCVVGPPGAGRVQPLRGGRFHLQQRRRRLPERDVPLPPDRRAVRRLGADEGTAIRSTSGRCTPTPRRSVHYVSQPRVKPALRFNYLSTAQDRRDWVGAIRHARRILGQAAFTAFDGGELSPGPEVQSDDEILGWVAKDAETALHPSCTCRMVSTGTPWSTPPRCGSTGCADCASSTPRCSPTSRTATSTRR